MNNVHNKKKVDSESPPFFLRSAFKVSFLIFIFSITLFYFTFLFDKVPTILNRGIQPATFPKALLLLIIFLNSIIYFLSLKKPWIKLEEIPKNFYYTLLIFIFFVFISKKIDFFLGLSILSCLIAYLWGERRKLYIFFIAVIFPLIVFIFFEMILNLRFPKGILTDLYYG